MTLVAISLVFLGEPLWGALIYFFSIWFSLGIFSVRVPFLKEMRIRGRWDRPLIAITFDDGPHPVYTEKILRILNDYNARATFFMVGEAASKNPKIVREVVKYGHEIGNHSMSHIHLLSLKSREKQHDEIKKCQATLEGLTGIYPRWYRPPMGYKTLRTFQAAEGLGLTVVGWEVKGWDSVFYRDDISANARKIARHILFWARHGSIILLHDAHTTKKEKYPGLPGQYQDRTPTIEALPMILKEFEEQQVRCVTLSELLEAKNE